MKSPTNCDAHVAEDLFQTCLVYHIFLLFSSIIFCLFD
ncbi:DUF6783 domain-containing protein [Blautia sp. HCP3S3_D9]|nr:DUF6783 domain-containing protein [Blautia sp.]MDY4117050.1 hypothetical protein [Blautia sp.]